MFHEFELGHNISEETNFFLQKMKAQLIMTTVNRCLEKFPSGCKNLHDKEKSGRRKTVDSQAVLLAIKTNPVSSTQRTLGELIISQPSVVYDPGIIIRTCRIVPHVIKLLRNFRLILVVLELPVVKWQKSSIVTWK